jgi:peroxiredoxin-like protein
MKNEDSFSYQAEIEWAGGRRGNLRFPKLPTLEVAAPPEFQGPGGGWTPEYLFVGAVASCFMLTFLALAERSKLELASVAVSAEGKLQKVSQTGYQITEVYLKPTVVVRRIDDTQRVERLLKKAEQSCFIAASIKSRVVVVPQIYHKQIPAYPCPAVSETSVPSEARKGVEGSSPRGGTVWTE